MEQGSAGKPQVKYLYRGIGSACLAAFGGKYELWEQAERDLASFDAGNFNFTCYDRAAHALFRSLVERHEKHPSWSFEQTRPDATPDRCPRMSTVEPNRGSVEGGYQVTITGENFPNPTRILFDYWDDNPIVVKPQDNGSRLTFPMPAFESAGEVYLTVVSGEADTGLPFVFEEAKSPSTDDEESDNPSDPSAESSEEPSNPPTDSPRESPTIGKG